ncbi:MAG: DegT/DnrJ/EryC1/StrS family aminotransferase, partial [Bacteroidota bacterium]
NLGAFGDGGAIFTRDAALAERLQMICNHGSKQRYYHDSIGVNSRLDAMQAAILRVKLRHLDRYTESRREAARRYDALLSELSGISLPIWHDDGSHVFHQYTIKIHGGSKPRNEIRSFLQERGIPSMIYYPVPCHLQPAYQEYGYQKGDLPQSEALCEQVISLPMHSELTSEQQTFIADSFSEAVQISLSIT